MLHPFLRHRSTRSPSALRQALTLPAVVGLAFACNIGLDYEVSKTDTAEGGEENPSIPGTWYRDADGDGYGDADEQVTSTSQPSGYVEDATDCDDGDATSYPGGDEYCDGADNDCDGIIDEDPLDGDTWYADNDLDAWGNPDDTVSACEQPPGYTDNTLDCDDTDPHEPVIVDAINGNTSGMGTNSDPLASLQAGIDQAMGCVLARAGTYAETIDFGGKSIAVRSIDGAQLTSIDPGTLPCDVSNASSCVAAVTIASGTNATPTLAGFTITGGSGATFYSSTSTTCADSAPSNQGNNTCTVHLYEYCGGGIYVAGDDPTLEDLTVHANLLPDFTQQAAGSFEQIWRYSYGGGLCIQGGNVSLEGVEVTSNQADTGGGIYAASGTMVSLSRAFVWNNVSSDGGGFYLDGADLSAINAVLTCNQADVDGGGIFTSGGGTVALTNTSLYGNASSTSGEQRGSQLFQQNNGTVQLHNVITEANSSVVALYGSGTGQFSYNDVYNSSDNALTYGGTFTAGAHDISSDPSFSDAHCSIESPPDFTLRTSSPAIDAGDPDAAYNDIDGTRNDMGGYGGPDGVW